MKQNLILLLLSLLLIGNGCTASSPVSPEDKAVLTRFFGYAVQNNIARLPVDKRIVAIGRFFIGTPYQGGTLEINPKEELVVNLRGFDCVTFVDNVLALALLKEYGEQSIGQYLNNLQQIRYRKGKITDYTARLHYSSDWLHEMNRIGLITDATRENGGIPFPNKVNFISRNAPKYPALQKDSSLVAKIAQVEKDVNNRNYYYIPKDQVPPKAGQIHDGDIILITTRVKGLDTSHVGIAIEENGEIYMLHASTSAKQVTITEVPLSEYLQRITSHSGIIIGRSVKIKSN